MARFRFVASGVARRLPPCGKSRHFRSGVVRLPGHIDAFRVAESHDCVGWHSLFPLDDIVNWEVQHGHVPLGAIIAVRRSATAHSSTSDTFPVSADAAQFLMDARNTRGFVIDTAANFGSDRELSREIALHGNYVVEGSAPLGALPQTGALIIVAPGKTEIPPRVPVRVLAMVG